MPRLDLCGDPGVLLLLGQGRFDDLFDERRRDHNHAVSISDDDVSRLDGSTAAGDGHIEIPRHVLATEYRRVGSLREHGQTDTRDLIEVAHTAVGDDSGSTAGAGAQGEDVAESAGGGVPARLNDDDLSFLDGIEQTLLSVVASAVAGE